jgi:hypothetical protein
VIEMCLESSLNAQSGQDYDLWDVQGECFAVVKAAARTMSNGKQTQRMIHTSVCHFCPREPFPCLPRTRDTSEASSGLSRTRQRLGSIWSLAQQLCKSNRVKSLTKVFAFRRTSHARALRRHRTTTWIRSFYCHLQTLHFIMYRYQSVFVFNVSEDPWSRVMRDVELLLSPGHPVFRQLDLTLCDLQSILGQHCLAHRDLKAALHVLQLPSGVVDLLS